MVGFALHERPRYIAEETYGLECVTQRCYLAPANSADYLRYWKAGECYRKGLPSRFFFHLTHDTLFTPPGVYAPPGKHFCLVEDYTVPQDDFFTKEEWEEIRKRVPEALLRDWQRYAPNMTEENVIDCFVLLGIDLRERFTWLCWSGITHISSQMGRCRPIPEWSTFRSHIKNLYLCGQTQHPGASSWGLPGYNCYKVIAKGLGVQKVSKNSKIK